MLNENQLKKPDYRLVRQEQDRITSERVRKFVEATKKAELLREQRALEEFINPFRG